jgi:hypothetical protein
MKHTKQRILSLVDKSTGEVANGFVQFAETKGYLPKYFALFAKEQKDLEKLSVKCVFFYFKLCRLMRKGNVLIMSGREIAEELNVPKSSVFRYLDILRKKDFMKSQGNYHVINPKYALNGGRAYYIQAYNEYYLLSKG